MRLREPTCPRDGRRNALDLRCRWARLAFGPRGAHRQRTTACQSATYGCVLYSRGVDVETREGYARSNFVFVGGVAASRRRPSLIALSVTLPIAEKVVLCDKVSDVSDKVKRF